MANRTVVLLFAAVGCDGDPCPRWHADADGDGFGDGPGLETCAPEDRKGRVANALDCDDDDPAIHPDADEVCDPEGADDDCDGLGDDADEGAVGAVDTWPDADLDGHGDPGGEVVRHCEAPAGRSASPDDCDDASPGTWLGAAEVESLDACMEDADGDGYGALTPTSAVALPGTDCDDEIPTARPGGSELFGDEIDQDCDGVAPWVLFDDFEAVAPDPAVWGSVTGSAVVIDSSQAQGARLLELAEQGTLITRPVDTTACESMTFGFQVHDEDTRPDQVLLLQFRDGADWVTLDRFAGSPTDRDFEPLYRFGVVTDPAARRLDLSLRLVAQLGVSSNESFYVDDFRFACAGPDGDGDGVGVRDDCDDAAADHWSDCGDCVDADGDGRGRLCDRGVDCDDGDPSAFPGNPDLDTDGVDDDCNGHDGPSLNETFEDDLLDPLVWAAVVGYALDENFVHRGVGSLALEKVSSVESQPFDASSCTNLWWSYWGRRGVGDAPEPGDSVVLSWWDGVGWIPFDVWPGIGATDAEFVERHGVITDPAAPWSGLQIRLETSNGADPFDGDYFRLDDLLVACADADDDADSLPADRDCDDADPDHWDDCVVCVDADGDDHGRRCDRGDDCDDSDATVSPVAPDPYGDGLDTDCDGYDGAALTDDFEAAGFDPAVWSALFEVEGTGSYSASGEYGGSIDQEDFAETVAFDASACPAVLWSYQGRRGTPPPGTDQYLILSWNDGSGWVTADRWQGSGDRDDEHFLRSGLVDDPLALWPGLRWRFDTSDGDISTARYYLDDFAIACSEPDLDGDGVAPIFDCDSADAGHWADCGVCVDPDGDDYGPDCDLGPDCAPTDPIVYPGAADPFGDAVDTDCSGRDGAGFFDGFELGEPNLAIWSAVTAAYQDAWFHSGSYALQLVGTTSAETGARDLGVCSSVAWSFRAMRGPSGPDVGEYVYFEAWTGASWVEITRVPGGVVDAAFLEYAGEVTQPAALWSGARLRLRADMSSEFSDEVHVDDLLVECVP